MSDMPVALITGAGSGIGRATAVKLAEAGYRVTLAGRTPDKLEQTGSLLPGLEGSGWVALQADVADPGDATGIVDRTLAAFGRLDALVNNAGFVELRPVARHTPEQVRTLFDINAVGPINTIIRALATFDAQKAGVIVNVSTMGTRDPFAGLGVYGAAKAAVETICTAIATEHKRTGVRAYCIGPGAVETGMLRSMFSEKIIPPAKALPPEAIADRIVACVLGTTALKNGQTEYVASP